MKLSATRLLIQAFKFVFAFKHDIYGLAAVDNWEATLPSIVLQQAIHTDNILQRKVSFNEPDLLVYLRWYDTPARCKIYCNTTARPGNCWNISCLCKNCTANFVSQGSHGCSWRAEKADPWWRLWKRCRKFWLLWCMTPAYQQWSWLAVLLYVKRCRTSSTSSSCWKTCIGLLSAWLVSK